MVLGKVKISRPFALSGISENQSHSHEVEQACQVKPGLLGQVAGGAGQGQAQAQSTLCALGHLREEQSQSHGLEQACQVIAGVTRTSPWWCWARSSSADPSHSPASPRRAIPFSRSGTSLSGKSWGYDDKSLVVLGKVKLSRPFALSGISEKSNPILMTWNKPVR